MQNPEVQNVDKTRGMRVPGCSEMLGWGREVAAPRGCYAAEPGPRTAFCALPRMGLTLFFARPQTAQELAEAY